MLFQWFLCLQKVQILKKKINVIKKNLYENIYSFYDV